MTNKYTTVLLIAFVAFAVAPTVAAPIRLEGLQTTYTPGTPLEFNVVLPSINELGAYNIDLVLSSTSGNAGTDFFFDVDATEPSGTNYVFASSANFFDAVNLDSASEQRLSLTDFDLAGVQVISGSNDQTARVVIGTDQFFTGDLMLAFDTSGLLLDTANANPTSIPEFDAILADTMASRSVELTAVPEPSSELLALLAVAMLIHRPRQTRTWFV